jgi:biopolymer transport protein ExbD
MSLRRRTEKEGFSLDLTTCSDIIFTLLLFYILTQNFIPQTPLELPPMQNAEQLENDTYIRIEIDEKGLLTWNKQAFTLDSLQNFANFKELEHSNDKPIIIFAHKMSPAGVSIELLDRLRKLNVSSVSFAGSVKERND